METTKNLKKRLITTFLALTVSVTALSFVTFSWFIFNRNAHIIGTNVGVDANFEVTYRLFEDDVLDTDNVIDFDNVYPGQVHRRKLTIETNNYGGAVKVTWLFKAPTSGQEVPYQDTAGTYGAANNYYYLGSQLQVNQVDTLVNGSSVTTTNATGAYLVTTNSVGLTKGQVNGVASPVTSIPRMNLVSAVTVPALQTAVITIYFTFVDNGTNQNVYKDGWPSVGVSARTLQLFLEEA